MYSVEEFNNGKIYMEVIFDELLNMGFDFEPMSNGVEFDCDGPFAYNQGGIGFLAGIEYLKGILKNGLEEELTEKELIKWLKAKGFKFNGEFNEMKYKPFYEAGFLYIKLNLAWLYFQILPYEAFLERGFPEIENYNETDAFFEEISNKIQEFDMFFDYNLKLHVGSICERIFNCVYWYTGFFELEDLNSYVFH